MFENLCNKNLKIIYKDLQLGKPYNKSVSGILEKVDGRFLFVKSLNRTVVVNSDDIVSIEEVD